MTVLFMDDFRFAADAVAAMANYTLNSGDGPYHALTAKGRTGARMIEVRAASNLSSRAYFGHAIFPTADGSATGKPFRLTFDFLLPAETTTIGSTPMLTFSSSTFGASYNGNSAASLYWNTDGSLQWKPGSSSGNMAAVYSPPGLVPRGTIVTIDIEIVNLSTGGYVKIWVDGVLAINSAGRSIAVVFTYWRFEGLQFNSAGPDANYGNIIVSDAADGQAFPIGPNVIDYVPVQDAALGKTAVNDAGASVALTTEFQDFTLPAISGTVLGAVALVRAKTEGSLPGVVEARLGSAVLGQRPGKAGAYEFNRYPVPANALATRPSIGLRGVA